MRSSWVTYLTILYPISGPNQPQCREFRNCDSGRRKTFKFRVLAMRPDQAKQTLRRNFHSPVMSGGLDHPPPLLDSKVVKQYGGRRREATALGSYPSSRSLLPTLGRGHDRVSSAALSLAQISSGGPGRCEQSDPTRRSRAPESRPGSRSERPGNAGARRAPVTASARMAPCWTLGINLGDRAGDDVHMISQEAHSWPACRFEREPRWRASWPAP